jgi:DNA-binding CsgD family transcriptional regulator
MESGSKEPVCISDFATRTEWEHTHLYNELFRPLRIRVQLGAVLKSEVGALGFSINRWSKDFSAEERTLLALAMPHLFQGWRRAATWTRMHATLGSLSLIEVDSRGAMRFCTPKAQQLMEGYFGTGALARGHVPGALQQWISAHAHECADVVPLPSFMLASLERRLVVRLVSRGAETFTLALEQTGLEHTSELLEVLGLTPREAEILLWISEGKTNAEIAIIIDSRTRTVTKHVEHIFAKLGVETRTAAAAMAWDVFRGV